MHFHARWCSLPHCSFSKPFLREQNKPLLSWPGNSPDMNTIENVWELVKREMAKDMTTSKQQLISKFIDVWSHNLKLQETVQECINSMSRSIKALIDAKGGTTKYRYYGQFFNFSSKNWYVNKYRSIPTSSLYLLSTIILIQLVFTFRHVKL